MGQNTVNDSWKNERPTQIAHSTIPKAQAMAPIQMAPLTTGESRKPNTGLLNDTHASTSENQAMYGSWDHARNVEAWVNGTRSSCITKSEKKAL